MTPATVSPNIPLIAPPAMLTSGPPSTRWRRFLGWLGLCSHWFYWPYEARPEAHHQACPLRVQCMFCHTEFVGTAGSLATLPRGGGFGEVSFYRPGHGVNQVGQ